MVDLSNSADVAPFSRFETASLSSTQRREISLSLEKLLPCMWTTFKDPVPEFESIVDLSSNQEPKEASTEITSDIDIVDMEETKIAGEPEVSFFVCMTTSLFLTLWQ